MSVGHVYNRGDRKNPNWWIAITTGYDEDGKKQRRQQRGGNEDGTLTARTKKEAETTLAAIVSKMNGGSYIEPSRMTMEEFLTEAWLPAIKSTVRESTLNSYRRNINRHVVPAIGSTRLQALTAAQLNALYASLLGKGLAVNTVRNIHVGIRKALGDALRWNYVARNVATAANPPKVSKKREMRAWTADELRTFLEYAVDDRLYPALHLAASTGLRRGEVLGLRWKDVDLDKGSLAVRQALIQVNQELRFESPKTNRGSRTVSLDARTASVLREHRKAMLEERFAVGQGFQDNGLCFCKVDGSPLLPSSFSQSFDRMVARTDLPRIRLHDLRHTHASLALQAGVPIKVVSERLGHASTSFTMDIYSHVMPGMQEDAAEKFDGLVFGDGS